ncbi:MAG: cation:proton antiporter [Candidatus Limnocylindria bacterium]
MENALPVLELGLVLLGAALAGVVARRAGLPAVVGYLAVGLSVGPFTPGYVADREQLETLANVGVVLLLFEVGIELDLRALGRESRALLVAAPLQVVLTIAGGALLLGAIGVEPLAGVTLGLALGLSSSVVVVNITRSRRRTTDPPTERTLVVWAILQDVTTLVAVAALTVLLFPDRAGAPYVAVAGMVAFFILAIAVNALVVPRVLRWVRREQDSFIIVAVSIALATAGIGSFFFGVPLALAAFVAGLGISLDREAREARREILPFRDVFAVLFFVAIGSLVDPQALVENLVWPAAFVGIVVLRSILVWGLAASMRIPGRPAQVAVGLGQVGEFSFIVAGLGLTAGAVSDAQFSAVLAIATVTIVLSTIGARLFPRRAARATEPAAS